MQEYDVAVILDSKHLLHNTDGISSAYNRACAVLGWRGPQCDFLLICIQQRALSLPKCVVSCLTRNPLPYCGLQWSTSVVSYIHYLKLGLLWTGAGGVCDRHNFICTRKMRIGRARRGRKSTAISSSPQESSSVLHIQLHQMFATSCTRHALNFRLVEGLGCLWKGVQQKRGGINPPSLSDFK